MFFKKKKNKKQFQKEKSIYIGNGYIVQSGIKKVNQSHIEYEKIKISDKTRLGHWLTVGTTGAGKTRFLENMVEHDIFEGYSVGIFDPKPDKELLARIIYAAKKANRLKDLVIIRADKPKISAKVNPFAFYFRPEELVQHVLAGIPPSTDEFYYNIAIEVSNVIIFGKYILYRLLGQKAPFTVEELRKYVSRAGLEKIRNQLNEIESSNDLNDPEFEKMWNTVLNCFDDLIASPQDYFAKVTSTLRTTLTSMVIGSTGTILGSADENLFLKRILNGESVIFVVQSPAMVMRNVTFILFRSILSMIQSLSGNIYLENIGNEGKLNPPLFLHIDELGEALYWDFINLLNKSRGSAIGIHGLIQSISDIKAKLRDKATADVLLGNFNTQLFFRVDGEDSAKYVSLKAGKIKKFTRIYSRGEYTSREVEELLIGESDATKLKDRHFILFTKKKNTPVIYKGETVNVEPAPVKISFN